MKSKIKRLTRSILLTLPIILSTRLLLNAQTLETKIEELNYNINCIKKIGYADFTYKQKENKYTINIDAETAGIITTSFFNRKYNFRTEGHVNNNDFIPRIYTFMNKGKDGYNAIEVNQIFDFKSLNVISSRRDNCKNQNYNKNTRISPEAKDIFSAIMEMRAKRIQDEAVLHIIESGEEQKYNVVYEGRRNININKKDYSVHRFRVSNATGKIGKLGKEAILYLNGDEKRTPLRLTLVDYLIGYVNVELNEEL